MTGRRDLQKAFMPLYTGDYLRKTRRLRAREHGAYVLLMMALWEEGGSLPHDEDELRRIACDDPRTWPATWKKIQPFFTIEEGRVSQKRVSEELVRFEKVRQAKVTGGINGGKKSAAKRKKNSECAEGKLQHSSSIQAKGLDSPSYEGENPSLAPRHRDEFARLLAAPHLQRWCKPESLKAVQEGLVAFDGETFFVSERCDDRTDWTRITAHVELCRYRLALSEQRTLRLIPGGKKDVG